MQREPISAGAPTRIDFVGGWTDVQPFCDEEPGLVVSAAYARFTRVTVRPSERPSGSSSEFVHAVRRRFNQEQVEIELTSEAPLGAGLGGSGAAGVALVAALAAYSGQALERSQIAELAHRIELEDLGVLGGKQDQYAAAYGGFLAMTFAGNAVQVEPIPLPESRVRELEAHSIVAFTGHARVSGDVHAKVQDAYRRRVPATLNALQTIRRTAWEFRAQLADGSLETLGALLDANWNAQKELHPATTNENIEILFESARRAGAAGGKALGAGGGGCLYFLAQSGAREEVERALAAGGAEILPVRFDLHGVRCPYSRP